MDLFGQLHFAPQGITGVFELNKQRELGLDKLVPDVVDCHRDYCCPNQEEEDTGPPEETYILTVQGPNKTGIVHGISSFCFSHNINIFDLATTLQNDQYTMALQLDLKGCSSSLATLQQELEAYSQQSGLTIMMQHNDIFQVTNEVTLH